MSNALLNLDAKSITAETYAIDKGEIAKKVEQYRDLSISGINDKAGLSIVRAGRLELRAVRCEIERRRKELKEGALSFGKAVDAVAKELTLLVEPTEKELAAKEEAVEKEIAAIARKRLDDRMSSLNAVNAGSSPSYVEALSDQAFDELLAEKTSAHQKAIAEKRAADEEAERVRQAEAEQRRIEQQKIEQERGEIEAAREALRKQQAEADRAAAAEREEIERQKREVEQEREKVEAAKRQAEQAAAKVAEEQRQKEAEQEREAKAAEDAARAEEVKPDGEKLAAFATKLSKMKLPEMKSEHSFTAWQLAQKTIDNAVNALNEIANSLANGGAF